MRTYYNTYLGKNHIKNIADKNRRLFFHKGENMKKTDYNTTWPPKRAVFGIGPNEERGLT